MIPRAKLYFFELKFETTIFHKFGVTNSMDVKNRLNWFLEELNQVLPGFTGKILWSLPFETYEEAEKVERWFLTVVYPKKTNNGYYWFENAQCFKPYNISRTSFDAAGGRSEIRQLNNDQVRAVFDWYFRYLKEHPEIEKRKKEAKLRLAA